MHNMILIFFVAFLSLHGLCIIFCLCMLVGDKEQAGVHASGDTPISLLSPVTLPKDEATKATGTTAAEQEKGLPPLSSPPSTAAFLNKVATKIPAKWKLFAYSLNMEEDALDEVTLKLQHSPTECFMSVFSSWKKERDPPFTWETVIDILQSPAVAEKNMAEDIKHNM